MSPALRRHGTTLVIVTLAAVAAVVVFVDRGSVTTGESIARRRKLLPVFRGDDVTEVDVTFATTHPPVSARIFRGDAGDAGQRPWQIETEGVREPAEEMVVDQLLASLREGVCERKFPIEESERKAFGLEGSHASRDQIAIAMGAQRYRVIRGGPAPTPPGAVYVEVEGHGGCVITAQLAAALAVTPDALRRHALVSWEASDLDALSLDGAGGPRHLVRAPWKVPQGASFRFDGSTPEGSVRAAGPALDQIWEALGRMKADVFLAADQPITPVVTVTLSPHGSKPVILELGGECPDQGHPDDVLAVRRREGAPRLATCVPRGVEEALSLPASDLVDRHLFGARADEVTDLTLQAGANKLAMARTGAQWHEQAPVDRPVDPDVGRAFLERLLAVQATGELAAGGDRAALGLDPPIATARVATVLGDEKGERIELLEVGAEKDGVVHVRRLEDGVIAAVPAEAAAALLPDELALRSKKLLDVPVPDFHALRVTGPLGEQRFERRPDGAWTLLEPHGEGLVPDAGMIAELAEAIGGLTVDRWVGAARPEQGLDRPRLSIVAEVGSGKSARTLEVTLGAPVGSGSFARLGADPAVFVAPRRLEAAADRWMIERTALLVDVERMTRVTLSAEGGKRLVLEQSGGALRVVGAPADAAATTRAAAVRDALGDLVADGAVSVGAPVKGQGFEAPALVVNVELGAARMELRFGASCSFHGSRGFYARRTGVAATFAVPGERVQALMDAVR